MLLLMDINVIAYGPNVYIFLILQVSWSTSLFIIGCSTIIIFDSGSSRTDLSFTQYVGGYKKKAWSILIYTEKHVDHCRCLLRNGDF